MKYKIIYQKNGKIELLKSDSLDKLPSNIVKITECRTFPSFRLFNNDKKNILRMFEQLSIMLNANITLKEAIDLSLQNEEDKKIKMILLKIQQAITSAQSIDKALEEFKDILGVVPILFLKLGIENGNIKQSLNSLTQLLKEDMKIKTKFDDTLRYPKLLILSLLISLGMIFTYVIPNFEYIFTINQHNIPLATEILININNIFHNYFDFILLSLLGIILILFSLYRKFSFFFHTIIITKIPIVSEVLKNYYLYRFFLLISIIVNSKYQFQVAIQNSKSVIPNLYAKKMIQIIINDIKNGTSISQAFQKRNFFDSLTIKLLFVAEHTASYETILEDIAHYYKHKFQVSLKLFSSYLEPSIILIIASIVLWLMLAIMTPIWNMSSFLS